MKRDLDLVRKLLLHFEERPDSRVELETQIDGYSFEQIQEHLILMHEAGLLRCETEVSQTGRVIFAHPFGLTWQGYEFLDTSRNSTTWNRAKDLVLKHVGGLSFEVLKDLLLHVAKKAVDAENAPM